VNDDIIVKIVNTWNELEIADLYRAGGWWKEEYRSEELPLLIRGSFLFAVAIEKKTGRAVGMGRMLSDGVSDGYIQDLVVLPAFRTFGIGSKILSTLVGNGREKGLTWIALIAEPGTEKFYLPLGFNKMEGYVPMILNGDES
jgi:ribosomal protein S18 acetylase RimI-like enzyme